MSGVLTAVLVVEFPAGMSPEGAEHTLKPARAALRVGGAVVAGEALGHSDPEAAAVRVLSAFWQDGASPPLQSFTCPCGMRGDLAAVVAHTKQCPEWT